jgi:hypothetical protein
MGTSTFAAWDFNRGEAKEVVRRAEWLAGSGCLRNERGGRRTKVKRTLCLGLLIVALMGVAALGTGPTPIGPVALTMSGTIALHNDIDIMKGAGVFRFDLDMVKALPYLAYTVTDPWMGEKLYGGVLLSDLLKYVGIPADAKRAVIIASDGKEFVVQIKDAFAYPILIAYSANDKVIKASSGGPLKLVFPYQIAGVEQLYAPEQWSWYVIGIRVEY